MDNPLLFKICFAVVTGRLVFEIIALCATAKAKRRKNGNNANTMPISSPNFWAESQNAALFLWRLLFG